MTEDKIELEIKPIPPQNNMIRTFANLAVIVLSAVLTFLAFQAFSSSKSLLPILLFFPAILFLAYIFKKKYTSEPLIFSNNGISIKDDISIKWEEIKSYKITALDMPSRKTLAIEYKEDNKVLDGPLLARYLYDKGLFFSEPQIVVVERLFGGRNIPKTI
jgi:hypothetical protein